MSIYPSSKALPYVYILTHKSTGQFYIGYREANILPADQDLPIYQTSSKYIRKIGFDNFDWIIIAEFFTGDDAYDFENRMIEEYFEDQSILNKQFIKEGHHRWKRTGPMSKDAVQKSAKSRTGRKASKEHRENISKSHKGKMFSLETRAKMSESAKGKFVSAETRFKQSSQRKGKTREFTEKWKQNIAKSRIGTTLSQETKIKIGLKSQNRTHSIESKEKMSKLKSNLICINNGVINKMIQKSELYNYTSLGWITGRKPKSS